MTRAAVLLFVVSGLLAAQGRSALTDGEHHGDPPFLLEEGWMPLLNGRDLGGWTGQGKDNPNEWFTTPGVFFDRLLSPTRLSGRKQAGSRIVNGPTGRTVNLVTEQKFGDMELYLEWTVSKGSNSGVYLHGLYEVQVFDSFGSTEPMKTSDAGGIYHRWMEGKPVGGSAPRVNVARPPGTGRAIRCGSGGRGSTPRVGRWRMRGFCGCCLTGFWCRRMSNLTAGHGRTCLWRRRRRIH
jgi:hypothetical protein